MSEAPVSQTSKAFREPRALTTEYHKARKQLMLWAAILFIWALVGIDLEKAKEAEGYAGALVKSIKSPQAVPWVLFALVIYFLFKCSIEWGQCQPERRQVRLARADFMSAVIVSCSAIALYIWQAVSRVQFADVVQSRPKLFLALIYGMILGTSLTFAAHEFRRYLSRRRAKRKHTLAPTIMLCTLSLFAISIAVGYGLNLYVVLGSATIIIPAAFFALFLKRKAAFPLDSLPKKS